MDCDCEFDCGYINKPYCALRPFSNIPSCPKFSCPPSLRCKQPHSFFPYNNCCSCYPYCSPPFCQPNLPLPYFPNFQPHIPSEPFCQPNNIVPKNNQSFSNPCCSPLSLLWFYGGFRCGQKRNLCKIPHNNFLKEFLKEKIN